MKTNAETQINIRLTEKQLADLKRIAQNRNQTMSGVVKMWIARANAPLEKAQ